MKKTLFEGVATAVVTPFKQDLSIDYKAFENIIENQINNGINAIVVAGTTGESPTLTKEEHYNLIKYAVETVAGRVPVIAGAGSNAAEHARILCKNSKIAGADGLLVVTPYYNKTNLSGLIEYYKMCSRATEDTLPIIAYNVPSRTGLDIKVDYYEKLIQIDNIVAVKEASGDVSKAAKIVADYGKDIDVYSGNDDLTLPILSVGGKGVISVASNVIPFPMANICKQYLGGNHEVATNEMLHYLKLINAMFMDVNPIPVKAAMELKGLCENILRLPLVPLDDEKYQKLKNIMIKYHIV
ncbi:MAG: 4-hydroxy-tetrahydrodipicolinate synthase [Lachnospiraceae bacterium]|nr:4-hydroxy-tetrahydrodipicolinate synthase [Lachnospiraceae bacterium]